MAKDNPINATRGGVNNSPVAPKPVVTPSGQGTPEKPRCPKCGSEDFETEQKHYATTIGSPHDAGEVEIKRCLKCYPKLASATSATPAITITAHLIPDGPAAPEVVAIGTPNKGGAYDQYIIRPQHPGEELWLNFPDNVTNEALLAIITHRLTAFQDGPFACQENTKALVHTQEALRWLRLRTMGRMGRGVVGKEVA